MPLSPIDYIKAVFDASKLPTKIFVASMAISGTLLFVPSQLLSKIHVEIASVKYGWIIGLVFLISFVMTTVNCTLWLVGNACSLWNKKVTKAKTFKLIQKSIENLDSSEAAVLREFLIKRKSTIKLPIGDPTVAGLIKNKILVQIGTLGENTIFGIFFPFAINEDALIFITLSKLELPEIITDADRVWINMNRPSFAQRIDHLDSLLNGSM